MRKKSSGHASAEATGPVLRDTADGTVRDPASLPNAALVGAILGVLLLVLAGLGIRDLIVRAGWLHGPEWLRGATHWGTGVGWQGWMWVVAVLLILAGAGMLWSSVQTRRRTYLSVGRGGVLWTRPRAVARRCSAAAGALPGVDRAVTVVGRRTVAVNVFGSPAAVDADAVRAAVQRVLDGLGLTAKVKVKIRSTVTRGSA